MQHFRFEREKMLYLKNIIYQSLSSRSKELLRVDSIRDGSALETEEESDDEEPESDPETDR